ncbi:MAG: signal peptidase I [Erysipelotrichales bacterium]
MDQENMEIKEVTKKKGMVREVGELVLIFVIIFVIFQTILMSVRVNGESMMNTYKDGERGIMLRTLPFNKVKHQDVVVIKTEGFYDEFIVKRVFGMPGDYVEIKNNKVYINKKEVDDPHRTKDSKMFDYPEIRLGNDQYFVLGDNRDNSSDSRVEDIGLIKEHQIKAVHGIMYWPLNEIGFMK